MAVVLYGLQIWGGIGELEAKEGLSDFPSEVARRRNQNFLSNEVFGCSLVL